MCPLDNIPRTLEHYVQEIGRAGRDGLLAYCHTFYDDTDVTRLRSLVHADGIDSIQIRRLLGRVFDGEPIKGKHKSMRPINVGDYVALEIDAIQEALVSCSYPCNIIISCHPTHYIQASHHICDIPSHHTHIYVHMLMFDV